MINGTNDVKLASKAATFQLVQLSAKNFRKSINCSKLYETPFKTNGKSILEFKIYFFLKPLSFI
jgi:hypothetical protein